MCKVQNRLQNKTNIFILTISTQRNGEVVVKFNVIRELY